MKNEVKHVALINIGTMGILIGLDYIVEGQFNWKFYGLIAIFLISFQISTIISKDYKTKGQKIGQTLVFILSWFAITTILSFYIQESAMDNAYLITAVVLMLLNLAWDLYQRSKHKSTEYASN